LRQYSRLTSHQERQKAEAKGNQESDGRHREIGKSETRKIGRMGKIGTFISLPHLSYPPHLLHLS
jgi:hypothetical protein